MDSRRRELAMASKVRPRIIGAGLVGLALMLAACGGGTKAVATSPPPAGSPSGVGSPSGAGSPSEQPVPTESSPPGDIPDNTAFIAYRAHGGFRFQVPEGWARTNTHSGVTFTDKLNTVAASWLPAASPRTAASAKQVEVPQLRTTERAFRLQDVTSVSLRGGKAVLITFRENSEPNPVTGKQYRLDVQRFEFFRAGTEAVLTLSSPVGADNVDPWRIISESFAWS
jgi:hypothetical protein